MRGRGGGARVRCLFWRVYTCGGRSPGGARRGKFRRARGGGGGVGLGVAARCELGAASRARARAALSGTQRNLRKAAAGARFFAPRRVSVYRSCV